MKLFNSRGSLSALAVASLTLTQTATLVRGDVVIDAFKTDASAWSATWGSAPVLSFDDTDDSTGSATKGCLKVTAEYFTPEDNGWEQFVVTRNFASPIEGKNFTHISIDVKVDESSVKTKDGNYGYFELKRAGTGTAFGGVNLSSTEWTTISFPVPPTEGTLNGILIQNGNGGFQGPVTVKLDNFRFIAPPPPQTVINRFDTEDERAAWSATWGSNPVLSFDPEDAGGGAEGSGSLKVVADYFTPEDNGWEQSVITRNFPTPIVGTDYISVSVDVKVDPSSVKTKDGNYGYFELKRPSGTPFGGVNLTSTDWTTITFNIPPTEGTLNGILIQNGNGGFQGPVTYYLDNFVFNQKPEGTPPPTLSIDKTTAPGLKLFASAPGQAYQRQNVYYKPAEEQANGLWWQNQGEPITYSVTWADFPNKENYSGFQGHIILARDTKKTSSPDWDDAHVILVEFQYAGGRARARFLHKVNEPAGNGMLYRTRDNAAAGPVGVLGEITAPSMIGTWSVTFNNNTDITLTNPEGNTVNLTMPEEDAPFYEPGVSGISTQFGVQPNADTRVGLSAVISRIQIIKGGNVVVDDSFTTLDLNEELWAVRAQDAKGVFPTPAEVTSIVSWSLPDDGFTLNSSTAVTGPWAPTEDPKLVGARRMLLINQATQPGASGFFQLLPTPAQ